MRERRRMSTRVCARDKKWTGRWNWIPFMVCHLLEFQIVRGEKRECFLLRVWNCSICLEPFDTPLPFVSVWVFSHVDRYTVNYSWARKLETYGCPVRGCLCSCLEGYIQALGLLCFIRSSRLSHVFQSFHTDCDQMSPHIIPHQKLGTKSNSVASCVTPDHAITSVSVCSFIQLASIESDL